MEDDEGKTVVFHLDVKRVAQVTVGGPFNRVLCD